MRRSIAVILALALVAPALAAAPAATENPLLAEWTTPFQVPPFAEIRPAHFLPAI